MDTSIQAPVPQVHEGASRPLRERGRKEARTDLKRTPGARERLATLEGMRLARKLRGMPPDDVERLVRIFVSAILSDLLRHGDLDLPKLLSLANVPMDLVIAHHQEIAAAAARNAPKQ